MPFRRHVRFLLDRVGLQLRHRYVQSLAGHFWAFIHPLILVGIFWLAFSRVMPTRLTVGGTQQGYVYFLISGFFAWQCISETISSGCATLRGNADIIRRMPIPVPLFFIEAVMIAATGLLVSMPLVLVVIAFAGIGPASTWLLVLPTLGLMLIQATALAMALGLANVFFRDIELFLPALLQLLLWTAPLVYPPEAIGEAYSWLLGLNPFSSGMILLREQILHAAPGGLSQWLAALAWCVVLVLLAGLLYHRVRDDLRDNL